MAYTYTIHGDDGRTFGEFPTAEALSIEELINALEAIQSHCIATHREGCGHSCPCSKDGICLLAHDGVFPKDWKLRHITDFSDMKVMY